MTKQGAIYFCFVFIGVGGIPLSLLIMKNYGFHGAICGSIGGAWTVAWMTFAQWYIRKNGTGA